MNHVAGFALQGDEAADNRLATFWVQNTKRQILKLFAHPLHTHAARERRIDIHGLARFLHLLFLPHRLDGAHVVQAVGQLDQNHAQVLGHRHEQFAEIFRLFGFAAGQLQVGQLGNAVDQHRDLVTEFFGHHAIAGLGVFDGVVQQGR